MTKENTVIMMTIGNALRYYRKYSAADKYMIGFVYKHSLYISTVDKLLPRWLTIKKESGKESYKLQLNLKAKHKKQLIKKGARLIGNDLSILNTVPKNKGKSLEKFISEENNIPWVADNVGFWIDGDITLDNIKYQVKFENAQVVTFKTLKNLQACGKDFRDYRPKKGRKKIA